MTQADGLEYWDMSEGPMPFARFLDFVMAQPGWEFRFFRDLERPGLRIEVVRRMPDGRKWAGTWFYDAAHMGAAAGDNGAWVWGRIVLLWRECVAASEREGGLDEV